jgi:hypothetical protein
MMSATTTSSRHSGAGGGGRAPKRQRRQVGDGVEDGGCHVDPYLRSGVRSSSDDDNSSGSRSCSSSSSGKSFPRLPQQLPAGIEELAPVLDEAQATTAAAADWRQHRQRLVEWLRTRVTRKQQDGVQQSPCPAVLRGHLLVRAAPPAHFASWAVAALCSQSSADSSSGGRGTTLVREGVDAVLLQRAGGWPVRCFLSARENFYLDGTTHAQALLTASMSVETTLAGVLSPDRTDPVAAWRHRYVVEALSGVLAGDIPRQPPCHGAFGPGATVAARQLFVSVGKTETQLHRDTYHNIYFCVQGCRQWAMLPPACSARIERSVDAVSVRDA